MNINLYSTASYACSYLPAQIARSQVAAPETKVGAEVYAELIQHGFRRSGTFTYRPQCPHCQACIPVRVELANFRQNRSQRRSWQQHQTLEISLHPLQDQPEYFPLYQRYQQKRHPAGGMDDADEAQYRSFLLESQVNSVLVEFREAGVLRMVSVVDVLPDGWSSVYTFYDPDIEGSSFGTFNVLWQIEQCRQQQLPYLYLGYWIRQSQKMAYKAHFSPLQALQNGAWQVLD
jgi:arginine-tRNA-protein transferase